MSFSLKTQNIDERVNLLKKNLELTNKLSEVISKKNKAIQNEMIVQKRNKELIQEIDLLKKELENFKRQKKSLKNQVNEYQTQIVNMNDIKTDLIKCKSEMEIILRQFKPVIIKTLPLV